VLASCCVTTAEPIEQSNSTNKKIAQPHTQETDVVNALEKLVTLQQQGFLTALEFKQAKAKLLDGFTSKIT
jgi:glutamate mutase epsilon subunit